MRKASVAFTCRTCGQDVGDPLYVGPGGHGRERECFDCYVGGLYGPRWRRRSARGIEPELVDLAWMLAQGCTREEIAGRLAMHRNTVTRRIERLARAPRLLERILELLGMGVGAAR